MLARLDAANQSAGNNEGYGFEPRTVHAAREFEALMMKELLAPMSRTSLEDSEEKESGILGEFASDSLAGALSAEGGLGIADRILHEFSRSGNFSEGSERIQERQKTSFSK